MDFFHQFWSPNKKSHSGDLPMEMFYRETDANIGKRVVQDNNDRWFWPWGQWTSWCTFGGERWQTAVSQSATCISYCNQSVHTGDCCIAPDHTHRHAWLYFLQQLLDCISYHAHLTLGTNWACIALNPIACLRVSSGCISCNLMESTGLPLHRRLHLHCTQN